MYDSKIVSAESLAASLEGRIQPLRNMMSLVVECIDATGCDAAAQDARHYDVSALSRRYGHAGSLVQRRIDALVHETEVESLAGCGLIARRGDRGAPGTSAAAHFLHRRMRDAFREIDRLLPLAA